MQKAGWCRECGEWVWLEEDGTCPGGHGEECISNVHEPVRHESDVPEQGVPSAEAVAHEPSEDEDQAGEGRSQAPLEMLGFGAGRMPAEIYAFSWGAFFLPVVWGIVYGVWPVVSVWLGTMLLPFAVSALFGLGTDSTASQILGAAIVTEMCVAAARLWVGSNANMWLWRKESLRLTLLQGTTPRFSVAQFISRQRVWVIVGAVLQSLSAGLLAFAALAPQEFYAILEQQQLLVGRRDMAMSLVWVIAEVVLAAWLAAQMRKERSTVRDTRDGESD